MKEFWEPLEYRYVKLGMYEISNQGRVRNIKTGQILKPCPSEKGYLMVCLRCFDNKSRNVKLHRMVASIFVPGRTKLRSEVNHINGNKNDCAASNLEWVTRQENIRHGFDNNLIPALRGTLNGMCINDESTIHKICETLLTFKGSINDTVIFLKCNGYECNKYLVSDIKYKKRWKHISDQYFNKDDFKH